MRVETSISGFFCRSRTVRFCIALGLCMSMLIMMSQAQTAGPFLNGFDLSNASIPVNQIIQGGPPRDGIPAIDNPKFLSVSDATFMRDDDLVLAVARNGINRAYPLRIMLWHEIVNDRFGEARLVITYCPLCGTAMVFDGVVNGEPLTFGVSGLLFQSDVLMYDRQSESLWSQLALKAVSGPRVGQTLRWLPSQVLTWAAWKKKFPAGEVLSTDTGFRRDYSFNPYAGYEQTQGIFPGVPLTRTEFPNKTWVVGIVREGQAKAYVVDRLPANTVFTDRVGNVDLRISYSPDGQEVNVTDAKTREAVPFVTSFWFAWQAFYPKTEIWAPLRLQINRQRALTISGEKSKRYLLESSDDMVRWTELRTVDLSESSVTLENIQTEGSWRFFRLRLIP